MKLVISDYCTAPKERIQLKYSGRNPFKISKVIPGLLMDFLEVPNWHVIEKEFKWDFSSDPIVFYISWEVEKGLDNRSDLVVSVKMRGTQSKREKLGEIEFLKIKGVIKTTYELASIPILGREITPLRPLIWVYHKLFYNKQRLKYIEKGRDIVLRIGDELKGMFGLLPVMA